MLDSPDRIVLSTHECYHVVELSKIIFCKSDNANTSFILEDGSEVTVAVSLKKVEQQLKEASFIRSHQSYLVNLRHVKAMNKSTDGTLILTHNIEVPVSARKKSEVIHFLKKSIRIQT